ncbi:UPF0415 protein C7orf25 homolog [Ricinus communis]|uniref:DUF1308 domain-containing protein n=1 Tax=Ricinus communis TaxID=3988 RepID=B9S0S1_RICCO|nr:UPF0415 protein C7orf25 homolog [Ricinus communis]EEF42801.1 conserved hypothetical protein [Ricinus communis]|eukprot:XP_002519590.1 UPF0415 protein C7orf25 homolog [Ricinus communis]
MEKKDILMEERVEIAVKRCERVIDRIHRLPLHTSINHSCTRTLLKLAHSELAFLSRTCPQPSLPLSVNIGHLEAVIHLLEHPFVSGVSRVCKSIKTTHSSKTIHVDVVCIFNKNPVWIIVSDRNPKYISWHDCFKLRIERLLAEARSSQIIKPTSILVFFARGLDDFVFEKLKYEFGAFEIELGFDLEDGWINVTDTPYQDSMFIEIKVDGTTSSRNAVLECAFVEKFDGLELQEEDTADDSFTSLISGFRYDGDLVNFDTTALIAIVSGISNGCREKLLAAPEIQLRQRFKGNFEFVVGQVLSEIQNPIHVEMADIIHGKGGIICESVLSEFKELVSLCGGPNEKLRADKILKSLMVVPDSPSERMMCLPTTRKLALKNKVVFGTGDHWRAPTLTANMAFVRAVSQTGMSLLTIEHRPRALTGD